MDETDLLPWYLRLIYTVDIYRRSIQQIYKQMHISYTNIYTYIYITHTQTHTSGRDEADKYIACWRRGGALGHGVSEARV